MPSPVVQLLSLLLLASPAVAQQDGVVTDGGGQEVLQSIVIPQIPNAPFSLTLSTEWARPLAGGGTYTVTNARPIARDTAGRIYEERWGLSPVGSNIPSTRTWIQIGDPTTHTLTQCNVRQRLCELLTLNPSAPPHDPALNQSAPLPNGHGFTTHEDLGAQYFAGQPVHQYRDTTTLNPGVFGNDRPMSTLRDVRFSPTLGINLSSVLDTPSLGRQTFTASNISTNEPDPALFTPPPGYRILDHRKPPQ